MARNFGDANNIINVSAAAIFQPAGISDRFIDFGNIVQVSGNFNVTKKAADWSINGLLQLAKNVVTAIKPEFTIQCNEFPVPNLFQLYGSTAKSVLSQTAASNATLSCANVAPYDVFRIPVENPTIVSVKQGATNLVLGVDYDVIAGPVGVKTSAIRFRSGSTFVDGTQTIVITYNTPAFSATTFPKAWSMDTFNNFNKSGYIEITFTDQYSNLFNHRLTGNCFLSSDKAPVYKPDDFATCEFVCSFQGAGKLWSIEV
jgi:hypothetical protein